MCHGLHVLDRLSRILGMNHTDFPQLVMVVKNKSGICVVCLNEYCIGCPIHHDDKLLLSEHYSIDVMFNNCVSTEVR